MENLGIRLTWLAALAVVLMTAGPGCAIAPVSIRAAKPAGPSPLGALVEASVPFAPGALSDPGSVTVVAPGGGAVPTQARAGQMWAAGGVRWLDVVFEATAGPGVYRLQDGNPPNLPALVRQQGRTWIAETSRMTLTLPQSDSPWTVSLAAPGPGGRVAVAQGQTTGDLILTRHDGKVFTASRADNLAVVVEEHGPLRATLMVAGTTRANDGETLFDFVMRWRVYRDRSQALLTVTWVNATAHEGEQLRDIRVPFQTAFTPDRQVVGAEQGVYDGPYQIAQTVSILQDDYDHYSARMSGADGETNSLASGGAEGERALGWYQLRAPGFGLGVYVPGFWREYPNELAGRGRELSVGLWPGGAATRLKGKRILPTNPAGGKAKYTHPKYEPIMPQPYLAFFDPAKDSLDVPRGVAKTQDMVVGVWGGQARPDFEDQYWSGSLMPVRGFVDPRQVAASGAVGALWPLDKTNFAVPERVLEESFGWFVRHVVHRKAFGKFDYGDFHYFTASPTYRTDEGTKWGELGEMPREGYWMNNERDPLRGILLHYLRTGDPDAWELGRAAARHLLDVDINHAGNFGIYTHSDGHVFRAKAAPGQADHAWLLGLLEWSGISADPIAWDWTIRCGDLLAANKLNYARTDARNAAVMLHEMTQFYQYTGNRKYLDAARPALDYVLSGQNPAGDWPFSPINKTPSSGAVGFSAHVIMALADYYSVTKDEKAWAPLTRALIWGANNDGQNPKIGHGELGMLLYGLGVAGEREPQGPWAGIATRVWAWMDRHQNRSPHALSRGDWWAAWKVYDPYNDAGLRPPQFINQTRPLDVGTALAYGPRSLSMMAKAKGLEMPSDPFAGLP